MSVAERTIGAPVDRIEGRDKVEGKAQYAFEHTPENVAYAALVQSTIANGRVTGVEAVDGVLAVLSYENALRLDDAEGELAVLQSPEVRYRGQIVAAVVAESPEIAQEAARGVRIEYETQEHDVELRDDHPTLYKPDTVNPNFDTDTEEGDVSRALKDAAHTIDETYRTPT